MDSSNSSSSRSRSLSSGQNVAPVDSSLEDLNMRSSNGVDERPLLSNDAVSEEWGEEGEVETPRTPFGRSPLLFFQERFQAGGIKGSIFTLVVAIVGAGTLSVPYAIQQSGLVLGLLLFATGACMAFFSLQLLVISSELSGIKSYKGIANHLYGKRMSYVAQGALLLNLYGTSISYIVAGGSMISKVLQVLFDEDDADDLPFYLEQKFVMIISTTFIITPLCLLRTMGALRYSSLIAVSCGVYLAIAVTVMYFDFCANDVVVEMDGNSQVVQCFWEKRESTQDKIVLVEFDFMKILNTIPIVVYAYTCHPNVLPIFLELQKPTRQRMYKVVGRAIALALLLYSLLGTFGYLTFKNQLEDSDGNFLNNDYNHRAATLLGAAGMSLSVILAVPLFVHAFRGNIYTLIAGERADPKNSPLSFHVGVSLLMILAALIPSILIKDISMVFKVLGSTTNPVICFILPSMFIIRAAPSDMYGKEKIVSVVLAVVITVVSMISLVKNIVDWTK